MSLDVYLACAHCDSTMFTANITHNLNKMAQEAGIYEAVWRPDENGFKTGADLIVPLATGIAAMKLDPERFRALEPPNRWGSYRVFVPWLEKYLAACQEHHTALVKVSR